MKTNTRSTIIAGLIASLVTMYANASGPAHPADSSHACSNLSLQGSYGFYRTGTTGAGPIAAIGTLHFDGYAVTGSQSISRNGVMQFDTPIIGKYDVNADCTGKLLAPDGITEIGRVVVVDHGDGFIILSESAGNAVYGVGRRIDND